MKYIGSKINGYGPFGSSSSRSMNLFVLKFIPFDSATKVMAMFPVFTISIEM